MSAAERFRALRARVASSRTWRAIAWYSRTRGAILCGGIAYAALFSLFAAMTIGYTTVTRLLGDHPQVIDAVLAEIDAVAPGLIDVGDGRGGILDPQSLVLADPISGGVSGIVAVAVLVYSAMVAVSALRRCVRVMFDRYDDDEGPVRVFGRQLAAFGAGLIALVVTGAATIVESRFGLDMLQAVGLEHASAISTSLSSIALTVVVYAFLVFVVVRVLAAVEAPRADVLIGSAVAGVVIAGLRYAGSSFVFASAHRNAFLGRYATFVIILLLVNLAAQVMLLTSAWIANPPRQESVSALGPDVPRGTAHASDLADGRD